MKGFTVLAIMCCGLLVQANDKKEEAGAKRTIIRPRPAPLPNIYLPGIIINAKEFNPRYRYCYCFRFKCHVPGMRNGFKGWLQNQNNKSGYITINGKLYVISRCDRKY